MSITAQQLAELMPDATQVESDEPEMERLAAQLKALGIEPEA